MSFASPFALSVWAIVALSLLALPLAVQVVRTRHGHQQQRGAGGRPDAVANTNPHLMHLDSVVD